MSIGSRIKLLRETNKHTQQDLAAMVGLSRSYISLIEADKREPSGEVLEIIADYYNVDMNYLYGKQTETNTHKIVTDAEYRLILAIRKLPEEVQEAIDRIAGVERK